MASGREQHEGSKLKVPGPAALVSKPAALAGKVVDKGGELGRGLGKALSPKRLVKKAAVGATLAMVKRHLGLVGAATGAVAVVGAAIFYAGRRSRRSAP
jgi:hypothetical protein